MGDISIFSGNSNLSPYDRVVCQVKGSFGAEPPPDTNPTNVYLDFQRSAGIILLVENGKVELFYQEHTLQVADKLERKAIALVQRALVALGLIQIKTDNCGFADLDFGYYGSRTRDALKVFQALINVTYDSADIKGYFYIKRKVSLAPGEKIEAKTVQALRHALIHVQLGEDWRAELQKQPKQ